MIVNSFTRLIAAGKVISSAIAAGTLSPTPAGTGYFLGTMQPEEVSARLASGYVPPVVVNQPRTTGGSLLSGLAEWAGGAVSLFATGGASLATTALTAARQLAPAATIPPRVIKPARATWMTSYQDSPTLPPRSAIQASLTFSLAQTLSQLYSRQVFRS